MGIIYCARNKINGKLYIGKTNNTLEHRKKKHESMAGSSKYYFHNAIGKYGKDSFSWSIIDSGYDDDTLSMLEQLYIDMFSSSIREHGYNSTHGGDGCTCNDVTRGKISKGNSGKKRTEEMISVQRNIKTEYYKNHAAYWTGKSRGKELMSHISSIRVYEHFCKTCGIYFCSKGSKLEHCNKCNPYPKRKRVGAFIKET